MSSNIKRYFLWPLLVAGALLAFTGYEFGAEALILAAILSVLEVTLSFDNAVVNAKILKKMSPIWQKRFLTWGILLAVFGTRFLLPIVIVSIAVFASPLAITLLALREPAEYSHLLESVHGSITAFGGTFLLMVALKYFFDQAKDIHWIHSIERHLVKIGKIEALEIVLTLIILLTLSFLSYGHELQILTSGVIGLILFILMEGVAGTLSEEGPSKAAGGLSLFIYLNVLDSAFSLDGVVGAFALTTNLFIIMIGLGIGAYFVRSMTVYFVKENTLAELRYLEHGAHWAILGLAVAMFVSLLYPVPEIVTGLIGLLFVGLSYVSSRREKLEK